MFSRTKMFCVMLCLVGLCLAMTVTASTKAGNRDVSAAAPHVSANNDPRGAQTDNQIAEAVGKTVRRSPWYDIFDWVDGSVQDGVVTLTGAVRKPWNSSDYESRVAKLPGVKQVKNELKVLPVSRFDDDIRRAAARAIYQDGQFVMYAMQANPPIHIVVDHGHVKLEGAVVSAMDKQLVETKVRNAVLAFEVDSDLQVSSR